MFKDVLSGLGFWTLIAGCCWIFSEASVPASQHLRSPLRSAVADNRPIHPQAATDFPVDRQMMAFERHARVNMLLYAGPLRGSGTMKPVAISSMAATR